MSDIVARYFGVFVWGNVLGVVGWSIYRKSRAGRLALQGRCARCKSAGASIPAPAGEGILCAACAEIRRNRDRVGALLWYGFMGVWLVVLFFGAWDSLRKGQGFPWGFTAGGALVGIALPLWLIRRLRMPSASESGGQQAP